MEFAFLIVGILVGAAVGFLLGKRGTTSELDSGELEKLKLEKATLAEGERRLSEERDILKADLKETQDRLSETEQSLASARTHFKDQENRQNDQKKEFEELNKRFNTEFENLANKILDEKSKKFTDQNKENLESILTPLRDRIKDFEKKVDEKYDNEQKERASLQGEIKLLHQLNKEISQEAHNLTAALKGDSKKQGNWGELILERILESSGLIKGEEYTTQETTYNDEGDRLFPDVVIQLPDNKQIIIDSKVSLVAYERFVNSDDDAEADKWIKAHVLSVKNHIKGLSDKNYHTSKGMNSPEFVLMFMPIESSFSASIRADDELFNYAWDKRIVIVSPSTLLATLRTVSSIWKQDRQTKNAIDIAEQSGLLYDKFVGFIEDMKKIGDRLDSTQKVYQEGMKKLSEGSGNLVKRAEELKKMGAKASKQLPSEILGLEDEDQ
ncbi:MAG: DNA recombination protein RmuC [Flavobacteriales bacterium]|nr:DNA recombination protein RmuC [Flavobacteriales bacterium]